MWVTVYTAEEVSQDNWGIIDETSITGSLVIDGLGKESSKFYAELMNLVYNRIKNDIEQGYVKEA